MPDIDKYAPRTGRIIGEDGEIYNLVDLLQGGGGGDVPDGSITTDKLADDAVTTDKLADGAVTTDKLAADAKAPLAGVADSADAVAWADVSDKPTTFTPASHQHNASDINAGTLSADRVPTLAQSKITNLTTDLASKLTATQAVAQSDSTAEDIETLVEDFNTLLQNLRDAGIIAT